MSIGDLDVARFARVFQSFLERIHDALPDHTTTLRQLVADHLGSDPATLSSLTERLHASDHPNLQLAIEALLDEAPGWRLVGLPAELLHYGQFSLASVLAGRFHGPSEPCAPEFLNVPTGVDQTLPCLRLGLYLLRLEGAPLVAMIGQSEDHGPRPGLLVDVVTPDGEVATRFMGRLRRLMHERNVYRGKILSFSHSEFGGFGVTFRALPAVGRDDIVLPAADLDAIEQHTVGVSRHAEVLRAAGRHLKRGLLLYGPPGTGKTLSVMYLCGQMPGRTTILLSGPGVGLLGQASAIARALQPSMIVLEDVDLVAMERTMPGMGTNPLLFQLLNEMDGLADDADVVFVLTTNRVELLEPALAARPGRIDQAVEIRLPDAECRRRLFDLYLRGLAVDTSTVEDLVERTEGVTASFVRELVRRAALQAAGQRPESSAAPLSLAPEQLRVALDDLLEHSAPVLRTSLGANPHLAEGAAQAVDGWFAYGPSRASATTTYEFGDHAGYV